MISAAQKAAKTKAMKRALSCYVSACSTDGTFLAPDVGVMIGFRTSLTQTDISCPYCKAAMKEAHGINPGRIVHVLKRTKDSMLALLHPIPDTHRTVACYGCKASFTVPKEGAWKGDF